MLKGHKEICRIYIVYILSREFVQLWAPFSFVRSGDLPCRCIQLANLTRHWHANIMQNKGRFQVTKNVSKECLPRHSRTWWGWCSLPVWWRHDRPRRPRSRSGNTGRCSTTLERHADVTMRLFSGDGRRHCFTRWC